MKRTASSPPDPSESRKLDLHAIANRNDVASVPMSIDAIGTARQNAVQLARGQSSEGQYNVIRCDWYQKRKRVDRVPLLV